MRRVCLRAIFRAVSLASVPLLQKNTRRSPSGASEATRRAADARTSL
jgi:hypothetical protein